MTLTILRDDTKKFLQGLSAMTSKHVFVGVPASTSTRSEDSETNAAIAYVQEFGSPAKNIPPRPFMFTGLRNAKPKTDALLKTADGKNIGQVLTKVGLVAVSSIKAALTAGEGFEPISQITIWQRERKGFKGRKPLIATGQLRNSIKFEVR